MQHEEHDWRDGRSGRQTLPHDFVFHYQERSPKTPEPPEIQESIEEMPVPQPPKLRIKRRRHAAPVDLSTATSDFVPLPTIELSSLEADLAPVLNIGASEPQGGFLAPSATARSLKRYGRILDNPKTPLDQVFNVFDAAYGNQAELTPNPHLEPIQRPSSIFSDSSDDDSDSSDSSPSFGDSCHSPDSETGETFPFPQSANGLHRLSSPLDFSSAHSTMRSTKSQKNYKWTQDMDDHLWSTYTTYMADPTVTPFKMLPGTAPPLGVCHRVARDAKKSWKGARPNLLQAFDGEAPPYQSLDATLAHVPAPLNFSLNGQRPARPQLSLRSLSGDMGRKPSFTWPREGITRRRLRDLCKRKPTLSPHYQRLLTRSPSPFESSSSSGKDGQSASFTSPPPRTNEATSAFSTRDMNISLATSTAESMQPDGPLSQLTSGTLKPRPYSTDYSRSSSRTGAAHQRSKSLHLSLGIGLSNHQINSFRKFAPSFHDNLLPTMEENASPLDATMSESQASLPVQQPRPLSLSLQRHNPYPRPESMTQDAAGNRRSFMDGLFRNSDDTATRRRSRGFSVGNARHSYTPRARHLSEIFTPPPSHGHVRAATVTDLGGFQFRATPLPEMPETPTSMMQDGQNQPQQSINPAAAEQIERLGSPFALDPSRRFSRTFPRAAFSSLDSMAGIQEPQTPTRRTAGPRTSSDGMLSSTMYRF